MGKKKNEGEFSAGSLSDLEALFGDMSSAAVGDISDTVIERLEEEEEDDGDDLPDIFGSVTTLKEKKVDKETAAKMGQSKQNSAREDLNYAPKRPKPEKVVVNGKVYTDITGFLTDTYSSEL